MTSGVDKQGAYGAYALPVKSTQNTQITKKSTQKSTQIFFVAD